MDNPIPEKRFALLIDADNVSAKYLKPILDELSKYGTVTYKRIYGDWTLNLHAKWKEELLKNSITPIQQFGYTQGKNATDSAMIIDAMDILYANSVEGFCIVSSDSDFTRLAVRLRESGRMVIGMGEQKTPVPFRTACDVFTTLELLAPTTRSSRRGRKGKFDDTTPIPEATATRQEIEQAVVNIISNNINNDKATGLGEIGSRLLKIYPDFDVRSYGTSQISKLLGSFKSIVLNKAGFNIAVELAEGIEPGSILTFEADEPAEEETEQVIEAAESTEEETPGRRRRRRGGRGRKKTEEAPAAEGEEAAAPEPAAEPAIEDPAEIPAAAEEAPEPKKPRRTRRTRKAKEEAVQEQPAPKSETATGSNEAKAEEPSAGTAQPDIKQTVDSFVIQKLASAGDEGITIAALSRTVRNKFKKFKLREQGYQNFRAYLSTLQNVQVTKGESDHVARLS